MQPTINVFLKAYLRYAYCCSWIIAALMGTVQIWVRLCLGLTVEGWGKGRSKGHYADDEALQPQQYNRLYCLTPPAQITFSSLRVHFPYPGWSMLVTTPSLTNQPTQLPTLRLGSKAPCTKCSYWLMACGLFLSVEAEGEHPRAILKSLVYLNRVWAS